jgi:hypothetical protein
MHDPTEQDPQQIPSLPRESNGIKSDRTGAYPLLAGDGAVPDHEVRRPVGQRIRSRHEPLQGHEEDQIGARIGRLRRETREGWVRRRARTWGWFFLQALRSSARRPRAIPPDIAGGGGWLLSSAPLSLGGLLCFVGLGSLRARTASFVSFFYLFPIIHFRITLLLLNYSSR